METQVDAEALTHKEIVEEVKIPVIEEVLTVGKSTVKSGGVRIIKTVSERDEVVDVPVTWESASVERVTVDRLLAADEPRPGPRTEGNTLIVPIFEEVLVVEKRLRVTEEIHIRRDSQTETVPQTVALRREEVRIEPLPITATADHSE